MIPGARICAIRERPEGIHFLSRFSLTNAGVGNPENSRPSAKQAFVVR